MRYNFIVSVGTSIVEKNKDNLPDLCDLKTKDIDDCFFSGSVLKSPLKMLEMTNTGGISSLVDGAEQDTVDKVIQNLSKTDDDEYIFHLIATRTPEGCFCAAFLKETWKEYTVEEPIFPEGLEGLGTDSSTETGTFEKKGLPNLLSKVADILDGITGPDDTCFIVPTGGYKAIIPYLTIASILYDYPCYYLYEDSEELVQLPAPPLGVNVPLLRSRLAIMENIHGRDVSEVKAFYDLLEEKFQRLFYEKDNKYQYTAFGERLKKMFGEAQTQPLVISATTSRLVDRLNNDHKEKFTQLAKLGASVWIGDKAPEMADHARYHHLNLFGYAELLLEPVLKKSNELFLLMGVIYLHDCGHTMASLPSKDGRIPLLQQEIRTYHNLLGYYRIIDGDFQQALKRQGVDLDALYYDAVARVSLYHRKKMPLLKNKYTGPDKKIYDPLCSICVQFDGSKIKGCRLKLIGALFRIIDGMDKQVARAGDAVEVAMKAESILAEVKEQWKKVEMLGKAISGDDKKRVHGLLKGIQVQAGAEDPAGSGASGPTCQGWACGCKKVSQKGSEETAAFSELEKIRGNFKARFELIWEYMAAVSRFEFLLKQPRHYYTDLILGLPKISHSEEGEIRIVTINYEINNDPNIKQARCNVRKIWKDIHKWVKKIGDHLSGIDLPGENLEDPQPLGKRLVEGIRKEYCRKQSSEVAQILWKYKIRIQFKYNGENISCWGGKGSCFSKLKKILKKKV